MENRPIDTAQADNTALVASIAAALALAVRSDAEPTATLNLAQSGAFKTIVNEFNRAEENRERDRAFKLTKAIFERAVMLADRSK